MLVLTSCTQGKKVKGKLTFRTCIQEKSFFVLECLHVLSAVMSRLYDQHSAQSYQL